MAALLKEDRDLDDPEDRDLDQIIMDTQAAWLGAEASFDAARWLTGDNALEIVTRWGQGSLQEFAELLGKNQESVRVYRWVASRFPPVTRVTRVSWSVHRVLAGVVDEKVRLSMLRQAAKGRSVTGRTGWTVQTAKERVAALGGLFDTHRRTRFRPRKDIFEGESESRDFRETYDPSDEQRWRRIHEVLLEAESLPWADVVASAPLKHKQQAYATLKRWRAFTKRTLRLFEQDPRRLKKVS
jgi:hypothetical protein